MYLNKRGVRKNGIGIGGFLGAVSRYYLSEMASKDVFPYGTLAVNFIGCLLLGFMLFSSLYTFPVEYRNFIAVGFVGSFTTMSTFSYGHEHDCIDYTEARVVPFNIFFRNAPV